jgi:hypothetical protein
MSVLSQLETDYNQAFKAKDELAVLTLRQLKTALTNAEIAKSRQALAEEEVIKLLRSEVKKRNEAAQLYSQGGRQDLADKERMEVEIISRYLPPEMSEEKIKEKIKEIVSKTGANSPKEIGQVTGLTMKELGGMANGSVVSRLVKEALSQ